jgi:transcriptional regulator GlxA family with amidase domain
MASRSLKTGPSCLLSLVHRVPGRLGTDGERPAVTAAREYMETHFAEDVTIAKLAALVSLSPFYFARAFEREIGLPPHAYLESIRIRKACELLDQGYTLVSTALSAGYVDQSHLTHRFKRILGVTPGQYVRRSKIRQGFEPETCALRDR